MFRSQRACVRDQEGQCRLVSRRRAHSRRVAEGRIPRLRQTLQPQNSSRGHSTGQEAGSAAQCLCTQTPRVLRQRDSHSTQQPRATSQTSTKSPSESREGTEEEQLYRSCFAAALCEKGLVLPVSPVPYAAGNQGPLKKKRLVNY